MNIITKHGTTNTAIIEDQGEYFIARVGERDGIRKLVSAGPPDPRNPGCLACGSFNSAGLRHVGRKYARLADARRALTLMGARDLV